jgi:hypothetical protein
MVLATLGPVTPLINFDIRPDPIDGFIDARDLIGWVERILEETEEGALLFDFSQYWQSAFPPPQKN